MDTVQIIFAASEQTATVSLLSTFGAIAAVSSCVLAAIPAILFARNLRLYVRPIRQHLVHFSRKPKVSILIPARNEERAIGAAVRAALGSRCVDHEVIVFDDHSSDSTAQIVRTIARTDTRVRLEHAPPLPDGWCGKQHACAVIAKRARHDLLLFIDADVRLAPDGAAQAIQFLLDSQADLISGIPRQFTITFPEKLLIPLIHFILLAFLPLQRMRSNCHPRYGAGCGQLMLVRRQAYERAGGHAAIRESLHDGLKLPRAFRAAGFRTDLFDATDVASCRMYHTGREVWAGLRKNALEGLAAPHIILPATILLGVGQAFPVGLCVLGAFGLLTSISWGMAISALILSYLPRILAAWMFRQSWLGAVLHPVGILALLTIQWSALWDWLFGRPANWRGRLYGEVSPS